MTTTTNRLTLVESQLMDSLEIPAGPVAPALTPRIRSPRPPRIWKFWGTALWGLFIFAAMFVGQSGVVAWFILRRGGPTDIAAAIHVVGGGLTISLSVAMGLPAVLAALWIAIRISRTPFADYLALRWPSWTDLVIGVVALIVLVMGWDHELFSCRKQGFDHALVGIEGFISLAWTALHLQYDWFFFGEVFSIGLLLGYLRYRFASIWLTIIVHGLNNLAAVAQTMLLTGQS